MPEYPRSPFERATSGTIRPKIDTDILSCIINQSYGVAWDESADTYVRTGALTGVACGSSPGNTLLPIQAAMRRCILNDSGVVQYYLDPTDSYNRHEHTPTITGTDDAGAANKVSDAVLATGTDDVGTPSKVSDVGVFTAAESEYVGKYVHNTTDDTYARITAKDSNDVLSIAADIMDITETFNIGVLSAPVADYVGHYVHNTTDDTYALITAKDSDAALSIDANIMANTEAFEICTAVLNGDDGQVMVEIPAFYYKYGYTGTTHTWEISQAPLSGFSLHPAFVKNDVYVAARYIGAYEGVLYDISALRYTNGLQLSAGSTDFVNATGAITRVGESHPFTRLDVGDKIVVAGTATNNGTFTVATAGDQTIIVSEGVNQELAVAATTIETQKDFANDSLCSVSGKTPINDLRRLDARAIAAKRGTGWRQQDYALISAVQLLYLTEYADFYSQSMIGNGLTDWSAGGWVGWNDYNPIEATGNSNGDGDATANTSGGDVTTGSYMTYRGIENFFGHIWKWVDGININANVPYVSNNDSDFADDTVTNYTALGITLPNTNGWQNTLEQQDRGFLPASIGAGSATKITDYYYQSTGWRVVRLGGSADNGAYAGAFDLHARSASSDVDRHIGVRLAY
jgi:hypothetical protein